MNMVLNVKGKELRGVLFTFYKDTCFLRYSKLIYHSRHIVHDKGVRNNVIACLLLKTTNCEIVTEV